MDPDGRWIESLWDAVNVAMGVESFVSNIHEGNVSDALVDGVGIALDAIASILPVVPGGASTTIKAVRTADKLSSVIPKTRNATKYNYRRVLQEVTGKIGKGYEAHHTLPQKHRDQFEKLGINIDDPGNVVWRKTENHRAGNAKHTKAWDEFWNKEREENKAITVDDIYKFRDELENNLWGNQYDIPME